MSTVHWEIDAVTYLRDTSTTVPKGDILFITLSSVGLFLYI